jgi:uncharacterized alkaline shock family protein YloU
MMRRASLPLPATDATNMPTTPEISSERQGKTTIAPDVLLTIARLSALGVAGVARVEPVPGGVDRLFKRGVHDGVRIAV